MPPPGASYVRAEHRIARSSPHIGRERRVALDPRPPDALGLAREAGVERAPIGAKTDSDSAPAPPRAPAIARTAAPRTSTLSSRSGRPRIRLHAAHAQMPRTGTRSEATSGRTGDRCRGNRFEGLVPCASARRRARPAASRVPITNVRRFITPSPQRDGQDGATIGRAADGLCPCATKCRSRLLTPP